MPVFLGGRAAARGPARRLAARWLDAARVVDLVRAVGLVVVLVAVSTAAPHPAASGRGLAIAVALGVCTVAWLAWMLGRGRRRVTIAALAVLGGAGGALAGLSPDSAAVAVGCVVAVTAGALLAAESSVGILAETLAAFLGTGLVAGAPAGFLLGYSFAFVGLWATGMTRRAYSLRAEQAELMLAETRRAREAETHAAALAERARIARDIHDVLAHSLAAVSVNLQAAVGLLGSETLPADNAELAGAIECVGRAAELTKEGLAAARRAVLALRDEAVPLPDQLSSLVGEYAAVGDAPIEFMVTGEARPVPAEAGLAAYRTAQEALTNARKHAPGQPVKLRLGFEPRQLTVAVVNPLPDGPPAGPLAASGAGYGLVGLQERAVLAGGSLEAGPQGGNWRVWLRIPA